MRFLAALAIALAAFVGMASAGAQETTANDPLTRYDDAQTTALQQEYDALLVEEEEYLRENPTASFREDEKKANALVDSRIRAMEDSPLPDPEDKNARAKELRRQAESLYAVQTFADDAGVNVQSEAYYDGASSIADDLRDEADEIEEEAAEEEAAREEERAAEEETTETAAETTGGAAGGAGGETPEEAEPPSQKLNGSGGEDGDSGVGGVPAGGVNLLPMLILGAAALGGVYLYARRSGGLEAVKESFSGLPKAPTPKTPPRASKKPTETPQSSPGEVTQPRRESQNAEGREEPALPSQTREKPPTEAETHSLDDEALSEWFAQEMPEKKEPRRSERSERRKKRRGGSEVPENVP